MAQPRLSEAEARVLRLAAAGLRSGEIADALHLSPAAVAWHLAQSYRKLGLGRDAAGPAEEDRPCTKLH
jgi:DNA-binding CsgD family transcriptional regulator